MKFCISKEINEIQFENKLSIFLTFVVLKLEDNIKDDKDKHPLNIDFILITFDVLKLLKSRVFKARQY